MLRFALYALNRVLVVFTTNHDFSPSHGNAALCCRDLVRTERVYSEHIRRTHKEAFACSILCFNGRVFGVGDCIIAILDNTLVRVS